MRSGGPSAATQLCNLTFMRSSFSDKMNEKLSNGSNECSDGGSAHASSVPDSSAARITIGDLRQVTPIFPSLYPPTIPA